MKLLQYNNKKISLVDIDDEISNQELMKKLNCSESWYYETKKRALLEFTMYYRGGCLL